MSLSPSLGRHFMLLNTMTIVHRAAEPDQPGHGAMASEIGPSVSLLTAPPSSTSASARMHSAEEWEAVRHLITGLYIQERMTLSKVMGILRESHDFVATAKQYKRKLQLWGLNKNVKGSEMKALVRKQQKRKEVGKKTVCRVRGYEIDEARISRYIARKAKQETGSALPGSPEDFGSGK
ncbi:hypothetical protein BDZ45DRAFT_167732 [Acephala macrosclerotiorum]|nr:hypothetical protein BDZ45DRAFT_167732 [Acephala macrosclerotiorum]